MHVEEAWEGSRISGRADWWGSSLEDWEKWLFFFQMSKYQNQELREIKKQGNILQIKNMIKHRNWHNEMEIYKLADRKLKISVTNNSGKKYMNKIIISTMT